MEDAICKHNLKLLRYRRIVWSAVYTNEISNARYINIIKVASDPFLKVASDS
jgi:hypothetical protein